MYLDDIYLPVPSDVFRPLPNKQEVRARHGFKDKFVIITVARHQPRKMVYQTAYAVAEWGKDKKDWVWVVKCDPNDPSMNDAPQNEKDLRWIMEQAGCLDRVLFEPKHIDDEQMNDLYNCGDVFIHLSGGEGFGVPYVEAMLTELPCILSDNTTSPELTKNWEFGLPVHIKGTKRLQQYGVDFDIPDIDIAVNHLDFAYNDWKTWGSAWLQEAGKKAREFHAYWCDTQKVADRWEEILWRIMRYNNKVLWHSFFGKGVGFSTISEAVIPELEKLGYDMYIRDWMSGSSPILDEHFKQLLDKSAAASGEMDFTKYPQIICWLMESFDSIKGDIKLGWSLCESTKLRAFYTQMCNKMDYILTSSDFNKAVQKESGVQAQIRVIPPCTDLPELERPAPGTRPLTFLHIGVLQERKNPEQALDGYCQAFDDDGNSKFILKSNDFGVWDIFKTKYTHRKDIEFLYTKDPPYTQEELLELYRRADVYINLSHGEGIGMPDLEAMATGLPVIGSNWDTRGLFLDEETGWPLKVAYFAPAYRGTVGEDCGDWAHYDGQDYISVLQDIKKNPAIAREKGKAAAKRVRENFTPEKAAKALDDVLFEIYAKGHTREKSCPYDAHYFNDVNKYTPEFHEGAAQYIIKTTDGAKGEVLDVGCGTGYLMKHLLAHGISITGIDYSDYAVENPLPECAGRIFKGDALNIPYPDQRFDLVVSWSVLEHIPEKDLPQALREIKRVGKRAFLEIAIPLFPGHAEQIAKEDNTHCTLKPFDWWKGKLEEAGLVVTFYDGKMNMVVEPKKYDVVPVKRGDRVLVEIPTKDRVDYLEKLLKSLEAQTFMDWDLLVIDDSKVDNLPAHKGCEAAVNRLHAVGHSWLFVRGVGQNQATAHNRALDYAAIHEYKLVLRLDDDITLEPDFMGKLYEEFIKDQECKYAAVGGIFLNPFVPKEEQVVPPGWETRPEFEGSIMPCVLHHQILQYPPEIDYRDDCQHLYSSYMFRTVLLQSVGGFPMNLSAMAFREETMPLYELWLKGYKYRIVTKAIGYHYNAPTGGLRSMSPRKAQELFLQDDTMFRRKIEELRKRYGPS
jgi:glycosyltransferase involved in cell wall biosynthesis/GT2 family glycosyltransferase